jgi:predicted nucleic acid-binding protein
MIAHRSTPAPYEYHRRTAPATDRSGVPAQELEQAAAYTARKDAPIVAAAVAANVDCSVTWDRKHPINPPEVAERSGLQVLTPGELMNSLRGKGP